MVDEINTNLDTTPLPPVTYTSVDAESSRLAVWIRRKTYGRHVRESLARFVEWISSRTNGIEKLAKDTQVISNNAISTVDAGIANMQTALADVIAEKNAIIANATVDSEVIVSRTAIDGTAFTTLKERLDHMETSDVAKLNQINAIQNQIDYVGLTDRLVKKYKSMQFVRTAIDKFELRLATSDLKGVIYSWRKDTNDDFYKLDSCGVGYGDALTENYQPIKGGTVEGIEGTFAWSGNFYYTTEVGASFTRQFTGTKVVMFLHEEPRSGVWEVYIDGVKHKEVSSYSKTVASSFKPYVLAEGLSNTSHTLKLVFKGKDPASTDTGTPRGYLSVPTDGNVMFSVYSTGATIQKELLKPHSNKEFAFSFVTSTGNNWVPEHNAIGVAFNLKPTTVILDGVAYSLSNMQVGKIYDFEEFELVQYLNAKGGTDYVGEIEALFSLDKRGVLEFGGKLKATKDFAITGYPLMLPVNDDNINQFNTSLGTKVLAKGDGSNEYFDDDDNSYSAIILSESNKNAFVSATLKNPIMTYRKGKDFKPDKGIFVWHRLGLPKLYFQSFENAPIKAGQTYTWAFDLMVGEIDGIYDVVNSEV